MSTVVKRHSRLVKPGKETKVREEKIPYFSRAVSKALEILEVIQIAKVPLGLNNIAKSLRLSKTSTFRLLKTLETTGHLVLNDSGHYELAQGIQSALSTQYLVRLLRTATPHLHELQRQLGETVTLAAAFENRIEVIIMLESQHKIRMSNVVGHILPPNASSLGKAITAFQTPERREKLLRSYGLYRFTSRTIVDATELSREFETVRAQKCAFDREESVENGLCFGVPVFEPDNSVSAAISTSIPKLRVGDKRREEEIFSLLRHTAEQLTQELTGR